MKIIHEKTQCIGCGVCVSLCPKYFEMGEDRKAHLKDSKVDEKNEKEELKIKEIECAQEAADACPVHCIYIKK